MEHRVKRDERDETSGETGLEVGGRREECRLQIVDCGSGLGDLGYEIWDVRYAIVDFV